MDDGPGGLLVGVLPGAEKGGDVFGDPDEEADQHERQQERHLEDAVEQAERHERLEEHDNQQRFQHPAHIIREMMREKVQIDQRADAAGVNGFRPVDHLQVESPPRLDDVTRDACIHEAAVERHAEHFAIGLLWIGPGTHMHFEDFECQADQVKDADRLQFVFRLEARRQHENLSEKAGDQQEIITRQIGDFDKFRDGQCCKDDEREDAGKRLLPRKMDQVFHGSAPPVLFE